MSFGFSIRWRRQMMRLLPASAVRTSVLDAMSGMGETWSEILRGIPDAQPAALDFSPRMIEHAGERNRGRFGGRFALLCQDMLESDIPDDAFDVVVSAYGMKTFDPAQSRRFAAELARVLRPGGTFSFVEVTEPPSRVLRALYSFYLSRVVPIVGRDPGLGSGRVPDAAPLPAAVRQRIPHDRRARGSPVAPGRATAALLRLRHELDGHPDRLIRLGRAPGRHDGRDMPSACGRSWSRTRRRPPTSPGTSSRPRSSRRPRRSDRRTIAIRRGSSPSCRSRAAEAAGWS